MERQVDVKTFIWKDRWIERQTKGKTIERQTEGKIDKGKDRQIERQTYGKMGGQKDRQREMPNAKWANQHVGRWEVSRMADRCLNRWTNEQKN